MPPPLKKAVLTTTERAAIERVLQMQSGYCLDFSTSRFDHFMAEHGVDTVYDAKYTGLSKAKKLQTFLAHAEPAHAADVLEGLLEHWAERAGSEAFNDPAPDVVRYRDAISRLRGTSVVRPVDWAAADHLSASYLSEIEAKIQKRLDGSDWEGAVTLARTLLEEILGAIEDRLCGARGSYEGDLNRQFKSVTKVMNIDENAVVDDKYKQVVRGLGQIIQGIGPITNKAGDRHARTVVPASHHARLAVNAARTVATFLVESYAYQSAKGTLFPKR